MFGGTNVLGARFPVHDRNKPVTALWAYWNGDHSENIGGHVRKPRVTISSRIPDCRLYGYHPHGLHYTLREDTTFTTPHPQTVGGDTTPVVGVHDILTVTSWETNPNPGVSMGTLMWHEVPLAAWTGTRSEFATQPDDVKTRALSVGPNFQKGRWGTHLGATMTVVTTDEKIVLRSREGRYAEDHLYDSLAAGTLRVQDLPNVHITTDYLRHLLAATNVSLERDVKDFVPTHLTARPSDFGLWIGGYVTVYSTAEEVMESAPFPTVAVSLSDVEQATGLGVPLTEWAVFDVYAAFIHYSGGLLMDPVWQP